MQVVGLEQPGRLRTDPDHDVAARAVDHDRDDQGLRRVTHLDAIETLDADLARVRELRGEPGRQAGLDRVHQWVVGKRM